MVWNAETMRAAIEAKIGQNAITSLEMIHISRNGGVTNALIDLITSMECEINELTIKKLPRGLELDSAVLERFAAKCGNLSKLIIWGMQELPD